MILSAGLLGAAGIARGAGTPARVPAPESPRTDRAPTTRAPVRCVAPTGPALAAESILRDLKDGKDVDLRARVIEGSLDADLVWPVADERRTSLRVLAGALTLESCLVQGRISLDHCVLKRGIALPCTEVRGDVDLSDSELRGGMSAPRAKISGGANLSRTFVAGDLQLGGSTIAGSVELSGARVVGAARLEGTELGGDLDASKSILGSIDISSAKVTGQVRFEDVLVVSGLAARETISGKGLVLDSVRVEEVTDLSDAGGAGAVTLKDLSVGQDLFLALAARGALTIDGLDVGRDLSLLDGHFGEVTMARVRVHGGTEIEGARFRSRVVIQDSNFGDTFTAYEASFEGDCEFRKVTFPGEDPLDGVLFARAPTLVDTPLPRPPVVRSADDSGDQDDEPDTEGEQP